MTLLPQKKKPFGAIVKLREAADSPIQALTVPLPAPHPAPPPAAPSPPSGPKAVHTLRKSEPVLLPAESQSIPSPHSNLPSHRHSDAELQEIRRREALAMLTPIANPKRAAVHPALLIPGYLCSPAAAIACVSYQVPLAITAPVVAVSLLVAVFIFFKKPVSRHHAAFIAVISLFVIVFGALHYFPQLRNAS